MTRFRIADINYLGAMDTLPYFYARDHERDNLVLESHRVRITDARTLPRAPALGREGFELLAHRSAVADFRDRAQVDALYGAEIASVIAQVTGADHVFAFGGVLRFSERERHPELVFLIPHLLDRGHQALSIV